LYILEVTLQETVGQLLLYCFSKAHKETSLICLCETSSFTQLEV